MSQSWPPQQPWPPQQGRPQPPYGPPNPNYPGTDNEYPDGGYGTPGYDSPGYDSPGYGSPGYGSPDSGYGSPGYGSPDSGYDGYPQQPSQPWQPQQPDGWPPTDGGARPQGSTSRPLYQEYPQYQQYQQYQQPPQYQPYRQDPLYQQDQYGSPNGHDEPYAPRRSLSWLLPALLVVVLILVAAGGVYALTRNGAHSPAARATTTASTTATGTPGIPQGFRAYTDTTAHIRFAIPPGWTATGSAGSADAASGLEVMSPDQNSFMLVKRYNFTGNNAGAASGALAGAAGSGTVTNKQGPTNVRFAGETWVKESGDAVINGAAVHMVVLVTSHGSGSYLVGFFSLSSAFTSANTHYFQPIQNSFTFTN